MSELMIGGLGIAALLVSILAGMHIMVSLGMIGFVGMIALAGMGAATSGVSTIFYSVTASFHFSVVPMFLLMGFFAMRAGLGEDLFNAASKWLGRLPGGLAIATTGGAAAFGAASGSSVGTATLFTKLALPEMLKHGYDKGLASASIAISGTLAVLIPPSALVVVYGILTDASIGKLLLAGLIPGILFTFIICMATMIRVMLNPALAPKIEQRFTLREKLWSLRMTGPLILIIASIIGGLYMGVFTPTEAGAVGALVTFIMAVIRQRGLRGVQLRSVLLDTVQTSTMIFAIIICALLFSRFLAFSGLAELVSDTLVGLDVNRWVIVFIIALIYIVLGMLMDAPALLAVTLPVTHPVMMSLGFDPIWFGIFVVVLAELGAITPPVGINCFVVKGVADGLVELEDIFRGILPYVIACLLMLVILCVFPGLALYLPQAMSR
jgi:tripartite ATP-independent transporter DctM subunit